MQSILGKLTKRLGQGLRGCLVNKSLENHLVMYSDVFFSKQVQAVYTCVKSLEVHPDCVVKTCKRNSHFGQSSLSLYTSGKA